MEDARVFHKAKGDVSYYPLSVCSFIVCALLFTVIGPKSSKRVWRPYTGLGKGVRVDWNTRVVSFVHASTVSVLSAYAYLYDEDMHQHPTWWNSGIVRATCAITIGYMIWDLFICTYYYKYMGDILYYFHHSVTVWSYYFVVTYGILPYFANFRLLSEISTPFLNIRWFLMTMGYTKTSRQFLANEVTLLVSYFLFRLLAIPLFWIQVILIFKNNGFSNLGYTPLVMVVGCLVLDTLNVYWYHKLLLSFKKILVRLRARASKDNVSNNNYRPSEKRGVKAVKSG